MQAVSHWQPHVVALDDDPAVRELLTEYLSENDLRVTALASGRELDATLARDPIDLLVLDLKLAGEDGMQIARRLRDSTSSLPILMLTGRSEEADRVMGLELGADDYLTKPFSPRELLARVRALLRRAGAQATVADAIARVRCYRFGNWELNIGLRRLKARRWHDRRADERRVQPADRIPVRAPARAHPRSAARALAPAQRRGVRPLDRRADPAAAAQDRAGPCEPHLHQDRARRRVPVRRRRAGRCAEASRRT